MVDPDVAKIAFVRAWKVYLLINKDVDENDARRATLKRFIRQRLDAASRMQKCWWWTASNISRSWTNPAQLRLSKFLAAISASAFQSGKSGTTGLSRSC